MSEIALHVCERILKIFHGGAKMYSFISLLYVFYVSRQSIKVSMKVVYIGAFSVFVLKTRSCAQPLSIGVRFEN